LPDFYLQNTCKFAVKSALAWKVVERERQSSGQPLCVHGGHGIADGLMVASMAYFP
jgi:hypothetical protein